MRNLKRALSLTLASVMLLGMMVVGSSAAAGYDDVADTDNVEAIEVLQAIEVMVGDERGFGPERPVNRAEMAVVMGKLLNLDYNYYEATCPFNDVYDWARGWVGACYANGIVSGRGEGVYDPGTTVTAVEAASMLMRALGYFKYQSDYANGFEVSTVSQATKIRLFDGVDSSTNAPLTRNQVAQMALNALKSGMVEPDGNALNFIDANGNVIATGGKVNYVYVTSNKAFATAISKTQASSMGSTNDAPIVELGEQLYNGKLKLDDSALDDFGRPSRHWEFDAKNIGTYVKKELIKQEYTVKVTGKTLYELLGSATIKDYDLDVYVDGVSDSDILDDAYFDARHLVRTYDKAVGKTGNGVLTQVFVDPDEGANGLITIAIINTYLTKAIEDYDDRTDDVDVRVYGIDEVRSTKQGVTYTEYVKAADIDTYADNKAPYDQHEDFKLELEDFPEAADVKDGDFFLVNVANGKIQALGKPEILSNTKISSFKLADWIVSGGTQYDFASAAEYEYETLSIYTLKNSAITNLKDINYNIYLDQYGYAIGVEEVDREDNYMFITGVDTNTNNRYNVQADANAIFLDGTMESIKIDMKAVDDLDDKHATLNALTNGERGGSLVNKWFTYSVGDDGVYDVALVDIDVEKFENGTRAGQFWTLTKNDTADETDSKLITGSTIVVGRGGSNNGIDKVDGPQDIVLRGAKAYGTPYYSVYGDDKSVFITAELNRINDAEDKPVNVIGGVDNVAVGVDNASIDVWGKSEAITKEGNGTNALATAYGSYVLYDDDGNIIGAVVVGEDSGSVTNLVYTHKERIESETDNNASDSKAAVKGTYTWTRKVVSDGEEVLLTEVGTGMSKLKNMKAYTWYVVKYNAKGEVKNVYPAWDTVGYGYKGLIDAPVLNDDGTLTDTVKNQDIRLKDRYVNWIEELYQATDENRTVLYEVGGYNDGDTNEWIHEAVGHQEYWYGDKPTVANHTFYMNTRTGAGKNQGFRVADDVKTVFIQTNNRDTTTTFEDGYSRLEKVVDRLHDRAEYNRDKWVGTGNLNDGPDVCHYEVSALMENGKAVVVVIRDLNDAGAVISDKTGNQELRLYGNLYTSPTTVTSASNTSVVVGNEEIKPNGVGRDKYKGNYTSYTIPVNSMVSINDRDIQEDTFDYLTNLTREDNLVVRKYLQTITFNMPNTVAEIAGSNVKITSDVEVEVGKTELKDLDAMFVNEKGDKVGSLRDKSVGDKVNIIIGSDLRTISAIEPNTSYIVNLGTPGTNYTATSSSLKTITIEDYVLTSEDIWMGVVVINDITADGSTPPVGEGQTKLTYTYNDEEVTVTGNVSPVKRGDPVELTVTAKTGYKDVVVKADGVAVELKDGKYVIETTGKESVKVEITVTKDSGSTDPDATTVSLGHNSMNMTKDAAIAVKGTGITAGAWYYISVAGTDLVGAQMADSKGTLSFAAPATGTAMDLYIVAVTPYGTPAAGDAMIVVGPYTDEEGDRITTDMLVTIPRAGTETGTSTQSLERAAAKRTQFFTFTVKKTDGTTVTVNCSKIAGKKGIHMFPSDAAKLTNIATITPAPDTSIKDTEPATTLTKFEAAGVNANNRNDLFTINSVTFQIGTPKTPGVDLVNEIKVKEGNNVKLIASIEWYEVDADGKVSAQPTKDITADAAKTYTPKVILTAGPNIDMKGTVTVNGTPVASVEQGKGIAVEVKDDKLVASAATESENFNVTATLTPGTGYIKNVTFTEYIPNAKAGVVPDALSDKEVLDALSRAKDGKVFAFTNKEKTQAESEDGTVTVSIASRTPTQVFDVTYPTNTGDKTVRVAASTGKLEGVADGVTALISTDTVKGTPDIAAITDKTATVPAIVKDTTYKAAVKLPTISTGALKETENNTTVLVVEYQDATGAWQKLDDRSGADSIASGSNLRFSQANGGYAFKGGETVALQINGLELASWKVGTDKKFTADNLKVIPVPGNKDLLTLAVTVQEVAAGDVSVKVGDKTYTFDANEKNPDNNKIKVTGLDKSKGIVLAYLDAKTKKYAELKANAAADQAGVVDVALSEINSLVGAGNIVAENNVVTLYLAYEVNSDGSQAWGAMYTADPSKLTGDALTKAKITAATYFPIGESDKAPTIYIQGAALTLVGETGSYKELPIDNRTNKMDVTNASSQLVWSYPLTKSASDSDFEAVVVFKTWTGKTLTIPAEMTKGETKEVENMVAGWATLSDGITTEKIDKVKENLTVEVKDLYTPNGSVLKGSKLSINAKLKDVSGKTAISGTIKADEEAWQRDWGAAVADAGSIGLFVNGIEMRVTLAVAARVATADDAAGDIADAGSTTKPVAPDEVPGKGNVNGEEIVVPPSGGETIVTPGDDTGEQGKTVVNVKVKYDAEGKIAGLENAVMGIDAGRQTITLKMVAPEGALGVATSKTGGWNLYEVSKVKDGEENGKTFMYFIIDLGAAGDKFSESTPEKEVVAKWFSKATGFAGTEDTVDSDELLGVVTYKITFEAADPS